MKTPTQSFRGQGVMRTTYGPVTTGLLQHPGPSRTPQCHSGKAESQSLLNTRRCHRHELVELLRQGYPVSPSWESGSKDQAVSTLVSRAVPLPFLVIRNSNANFNVLELEIVLLNHFLLPFINVWHVYYIKKHFPLNCKIMTFMEH